MPGEVQFDGAPRLAAIRVEEGAVQVRVGQDPPPVVAQADARIAQLGRRRHGLHVDQRVVGFGSRVRLHRAAHAGHCRMIHAGHLTVVHTGHAAMVHPAHLAVVHARHPALRGTVIHARHAAVIHAHIRHANQRARVDVWNRRTQPLAHRQGAAGVTATVHGLREEGVGLLALGLDYDVVGFGHGDTELVDADRLDVLPVGRHHCHLQARDAHIEVGHGRGIDEAQTELLAGLEDAGPVAVRRLAVHQVGVGIGTDIGEVGGAHLHLGPHLAVGNCGGPALGADVVDEVTDGALVLVVVVRLLLQLGQDARGVLIGPVAQHHHVVAVVAERLGLFRVDHQGAVDPDLLLQARVAVVPVGTVLVDLESVLVQAVGGDAMEAQAGHAIHVGRQDHAVPMDGGILPETIAHAQGDRITFAPTQNRSGQRTVDGHGGARRTGNVYRGLSDKQIEIGATQHVGLAGAGHGPDRRAPQPQAAQDTGGGQAFDEGSPRGFAVHTIVSSQISRKDQDRRWCCWRLQFQWVLPAADGAPVTAAAGSMKLPHLPPQGDYISVSLAQQLACLSCLPCSPATGASPFCC
ncbi:hypothetical protein FQZ97_421110 [compost metagenome]